MRRYAHLLVLALSLAPATLPAQQVDSPARPVTAPAPARPAADPARIPPASASAPAAPSPQAQWTGVGVAATLAAGMLLFVGLAMRHAPGGGPRFAVQSHWGGFGGGLGGWRVTPPLVYLAVALAFALMLTVVASALLRAPGATAGAPATRRAAPADSAR